MYNTQCVLNYRLFLVEDFFFGEVRMLIFLKELDLEPLLKRKPGFRVGCKNLPPKRKVHAKNA